MRAFLLIFFFAAVVLAIVWEELENRFKLGEKGFRIFKITVGVVAALVLLLFISRFHQ